MKFVRNCFLLLLLLLASSPVYANPDMTVLNPLDGNLIVTSEFSMGRMHPVYGYVRKHLGVDLAAETGANIYAALPGTVTFTGWDEGGYGNWLSIHSIINGADVETRYGHCSALLVGAGTEVAAGTIVAKVGSTGAATGPHLHFEIRINGVPVDPALYLRGLPPSSGVGYALLPESVKNTFDAEYDFGKPLREVIEKFGEITQTAMKNLLNIVKWLLVTLIIIDLAWAFYEFVLDENSGENLFDFLLSKVFLYALLIYFLTNWRLLFTPQLKTFQI